MSRTTLQTVVRGLLGRLAIADNPAYPNSRALQAVFMLINGGLTIGLLAGLAYLAQSPLIFPSLGPTAFLLFHRPLAAASSPRNAVLGHLVGIVMGMMSLSFFGLVGEPANLALGVPAERIGAAALSLGGTGAAMVILNVVHPPAGATTLIISLGLMPYLWQMPVLIGAVYVLIIQALFINRLAGIPYPWWNPIVKTNPNHPTPGG